jgi:hypothetical protein
LLIEPGEDRVRLQVVLYWQVQKATDSSYKVFVQALGPDGRIVGQYDGLPAGGTFHTNEWVKGEVVADRHVIDIDLETLIRGEYRLVAGMYDEVTGQSLLTPKGGSFILLQTFLLE